MYNTYLRHFIIINAGTLTQTPNFDVNQILYIYNFTRDNFVLLG